MSLGAGFESVVSPHSEFALSAFCLLLPCSTSVPHPHYCNRPMKFPLSRTENPIQPLGIGGRTGFLCVSPGCLGTHCVDQAGLEFKGLCLPSTEIKSVSHHRPVQINYSVSCLGCSILLQQQESNYYRHQALILPWEGRHNSVLIITNRRC